MKREYDFSKARRGAVLPPEKGKTRITIFLDNAVLKAFRVRAEKAHVGYQTMINDALKTHLEGDRAPITEKSLRSILRQELPAYVANSGGTESPPLPVKRPRKSK